MVATIAGDTKTVKTTDFKIINTRTNATVPVKSVSIDKKDASKVTVECFGDMKEDVFAVTLDGKTVNFTATDAKVTGLQLSTTNVTAGKETAVYVQTIDVNNVILTETGINASANNVTSALTITKGYVSGADKVYLPTVGDTMTVKSTYHTYKFDSTGKEEGTIEQTFTLTAVDATASEYAYSLTLGDNAPAWKANSFKANTSIKENAGTNAWIRIQDTSVTPATDLSTADYAKYEVESSDKTKLLVEAATLSGATVGSSPVSVQGVSAGDAYIIVKEKDSKKVVASLKVTVQGKPVATTMEVSATSATVVTGSSESAKVTVTIKDQYGNKMNANITEAKAIAAPNTAALNVAPAGSVEDDGTDAPKVKFDASNTNQYVAYGAYTYKITAKADNVSLSRTVVLNVVNTSATKSYDVVVGDVDTTVNSWDTAGKTFTIKVAEMVNGGVESYLSTVSEVAIRDSKNVTIARVGATVTSANLVTCAAVATSSAYQNGVVTVTASAVSAGASGKNYYVKNLDAGTYYVDVTFLKADGTKGQLTRSFTVADTQDKKASYELVTDVFTGQTVKDAFETSSDTASALVRVYYDGMIQNQVTVIDVDGTKLANGGAFVKTVKCYVNVSGSKNYVPVTITVNDQVKDCTNLK